MSDSQHQEENVKDDTVTLDFALEELVFSSGTRIPIEENETIFIVGPNNSGKSATLKEVESQLRSHSAAKTVLQEIKYRFNSDLNETTKYVKEKCSKILNQNKQLVYQIGNAGLAESNIRQVYNQRGTGLGHLTGLVCKYLNTESRLTDSNPATRIDFKKSPMSHPIHFLEKFPDKEDEICNLFEKAFSQPIYIDRNAGNVTPITIGSVYEKSYKEKRFDTKIMERIGELPRLEEQGDGMRSFVSILLSTKINQRKLVLIDEPEAFLHPVQIRLLGDSLTNRDKEAFQTLISTHSGDLLRSAISKNDRQIKIIRLERQGTINIPKVLHKDDISNLWNDPLLRYSNILDGIFHSTTIICESDSDCRFYSAILEEICSAKDISPDVLFTHCGGKHRIKTAVAALKRLGVKTKAICDIDLLCEENTSRELLEVAGGDWNHVKGDWSALNGATKVDGTRIMKDKALSEIEALIRNEESKYITKRTERRIIETIKAKSVWKQLKKGGLDSGILKGDVYKSTLNIINKFKDVDIYIVPEGEAESFVKSESDHGPEWVGKVLSNYNLAGPELLKARDFIETVCSDFL
ncbi:MULTISPECIES: ATP-dependent nuclease [Marinobacter]|uniref:ATP-dependent nuclease n=1 Tax=Marinobacter TaxID=2742 RepID=UPI003B42826F|nr:AAA family ATPase [Marinobacter alkaliphilus]